MVSPVRIQIAKSHRESNCIGTALFLTECIDFEVTIKASVFNRVIDDYLQPGPPEPGNLATIYCCGLLWHMAIVTGTSPMAVLHRHSTNSPIIENDSMDRLLESFEEVQLPTTTKFYTPAPVLLNDSLYPRAQKNNFDAIYGHILNKYIQTLPTA